MQILELAEYYSLSTEEQNVYDIAFNRAWATFDAVETAKNKGIEQGKKARDLEIARGMLNDKMQIEVIMKYTGLSREEINNLK